MDKVTLGNAAVYRLSSDGTVTDVANVTTKRQTGMKLWGLSMDGEGNLYFCELTSSRVKQMHKDGTNIRALLTSSHGVQSPLAISVCGDKLALSCFYRDFIVIYQMV